MISSEPHIRDRVLDLLVALAQANDEQQIVIAMSMFLDSSANMRLLYLDLDERGQPITVRVVANRRGEGTLVADPSLHKSISTKHVPLIEAIIQYRDPVWFEDDIKSVTRLGESGILQEARGFIATKLYGRALTEADHHWHSILLITWPHRRSFDQAERYLYTAIWETLSVVVSNHRLRVNALENVKRLQEVDRLKTQFLQMITHEMRSPLVGLTTAIEGMLLEAYGSLNDEMRSDLEQIHEGGTYLLTLINDVLDMAAIEAGMLDIQLRPISIDEVIRRSLQLVREVADEKSLSIVIDCPQDLPLAYADPNRVRQVLVNLISNAVTYSSKGEIRVSARSEAQEIIIAVADEGIGIPEEELKKVFNPFHRVKQSTTIINGTGLGLSISKQLVEHQGGRIWFQSKLGQGSTFYFSVPVVSNNDENTLR